MEEEELRTLLDEEEKTGLEYKKKCEEGMVDIAHLHLKVDILQVSIRGSHAT